MPPADDIRPPIELQLGNFRPQPPAIQALEEEHDITPSAPVPKTATEPTPGPPKSTADTEPDVESPLLTANLQVRVSEHELETMNEQQKSRLTNAVLARQFITEESAVDKLFDRPPEQHSSELQKGFHYPVRQDLITLLNQPMSELPFKYTPGLIRFAYDPGVKGDLQRFWDVITPEFGWRTKNGTEFKCIWVLVIAGCGWK